MSPPVQAIARDDRLPAEADIVVIGGGIIGAAAAYTLAKRGHSVALVEKGVVGGEQSSRNWGWCRQQNRDEREIPLIKRSLEIWGELGREIGDDLGFRRTGLVYVTTKPADIAAWERWADIARPYQIASRVLSAAEAKRMTPGSVGDWIGGVHSPGDGRAEPMLAAPALAKAAQRLRATIHQGCAARGVETAAGRVAGVVTERGTIRTQAVLCAGGAWASMFCRRHGIRFPQAGVRSTSFYTNAAPQVTEGGVSTPDVTLRRREDGGYTVGLSGRGLLNITPQGLRYAREFWPTFQRRRRNLTIRLGTAAWRGPEALGSWSFDRTSPFERIRVLDPAPQQSLIDRGLRVLREVYPALADVRAVCAWGGWVDATPDAIPVISPVTSLPGFYLAAGFSGHGFGIGPAAGQLAADLITGDTPLVDPTPFRHSRMVDGTDLGAPSRLI